MGKRIVLFIDGSRVAIVYFKTNCKSSVRNLKLEIIKQYAIKLFQNSNYEPHSYVY